MKRDIIILLSGGLDSTTALYEYRDEIALALVFDYGSKHSDKEIACAKRHCEKWNIPCQVITLDFAGMGFRSALLKEGGEIPTGSYEIETMRQTVVPFRNGIMLSIAAGIAESNHCQRLLLSNHAGDHAIYPDCREGFIKAIDEAIQQGTYNGVRVFAPYTLLSKRDIALRGKALGIPYEETWSCYVGGEKHCGVCSTCVERREALSGFDKTPYESQK